MKPRIGIQRQLSGPPPTPPELMMRKIRQLEAQGYRMEKTDEGYVMVQKPKEITYYEAVQDLPEKAKVTGFKKTPEGAEVTYYVPVPAQREKPKKPFYLFEFVEGLGKQYEKSPVGIVRKTSPSFLPDTTIGSYMMLSGIVKAGESIFRPEIRTLGGATVQTYLSTRTDPFAPSLPFLAHRQTPFQTYWGSLPKGYEVPTIMGEAFGEYLLGRYVFAPMLEKGWSGIKHLGGKAKAKLFPSKPVETGWKRTALGSRGWEYETVSGYPGKPTPITKPQPSFLVDEDTMRFLPQTGRATSHPVPIQIEGETPWVVLQKYPPTPKGGGLMRTILRTDIDDLSKLALRGISKKTLLAPFFMETISPKTIFPKAIFGVAGAQFLKGVLPKGYDAEDVMAISPRETVTIKEPKIQDIVKLKPISELKMGKLMLPEKKQTPKVQPDLGFQTIVGIEAIQQQLPQQKTMQQQIQKMFTPQPAPLTKMRPPRWLDISRRKRRRKDEMGIFGLYGRYPIKWPTLGPGQVMKMEEFFGV